ncbi:MAG: FG-GAP-like repeat-containing protein [Myxococcales bacterium]|nr:FG-GAP-like repeat-containing protein [Myxococcales bacterium]
MIRFVAALALLVGASALAGVNPDGSFSQRLAIAIPAGAGGVHPTLALAYDSNSPDGLVGRGWRLEGLPIVTRARLGGGPRFDASDALQTHEGVLVREGNTGPYRAQHDNQSAWFFEGTCGSGPCSLRMEDRDGWRWYFGESDNARLREYSTVAAWGLSRVVSPSGLSWSVRWLNAERQLLPESVSWTHGAGAELRRVAFTYDARPATDRIPTFTTELEGSLDRRLSRITVTSAEVPVREYRLTYDAVERRRSLLTSVREYGADGTSALSPLTFRYAPVQQGPSNIGDTFPGTTDITTRGGRTGIDWSDERHRLLTGDFDGDGKTDLLLQGVIEPQLGGVSTDTLLWRSSAQAWTNVTAGDTSELRLWNFRQSVAIAADFDDDGKSDVLLLSVDTSTVPRLMRSNGDGTFTARFIHGPGMGADEWALSYASLAGAYRRTPIPGDFDGDGLLDVLLQPNRETEQARMWFGTGRVVLLGNESSIASPELWASNRTLPTPGDFNGDGVTDLLMQGLDSNQAHRVLFFDRTGTYSEWTSMPTLAGGAEWTTRRRRAVTLDANGDGLTDIFLKPVTAGEDGILVLSRGRTFSLRSERYADGEDPFQAFPGDFDGDGRSDLLMFDPARGISFIGWSSTGAALEPTVPRGNSGPPTQQAAVGDFDGDGRSDLLFTTPSTATLWTAPATPPLVMVEATNGSGGRLVIDYQVATNHPTALMGTGPGRANPSPVALVTRVTSHDGTRASYATTWQYFNARLLRRPTPGTRLGAMVNLGFERVDERDVQTGQTISRSYNQRAPGQGLVVSVTHNDATGEPTVIEATVGVRNLACVPLTICDANGEHPLGLALWRPTELRTTSFEGGVRRYERSRAFLYDSYANPREVTDVVSRADGRGGLETVRTRFELNSYMNQDRPVRAIGLPWRGRVCTDRDCTTVITDVRTTYDDAPYGQTGTRLFATKVEQAAGANWVATTRTHDSAGNIVTETGPDGLTTRLRYDVLFQRDRVFQEEPGTPRRTFTVDHRFNVPIEEQDDNGTTVSTTLDVFGRPTRKRWVGNDGRVMRERVLAQRAATATAFGSASVCEVGPPGEPLDDCRYTYVDSLGRTRRSVVWGAHGLVEMTTTYDAAGRVWKTSEPHVPNDPELAWTVTEYDDAGRTSRVVHPDGTATTHRYNTVLGVDTELESELVTGPTGVATFKAKDIDGHVVRVSEGTVSSGLSVALITRSTYDVKGRLTRIDSPLKATVIEWDDYGRKRAIEDPDTGRTEYTYDTGAEGRVAWGRLRTMTRPDPNGGAGRITTTYTYEAAGRVAREVSSDGTEVTYTYDDPAVTNGLGKVTRIAQVRAGVTLVSSYAYDGLGNRSRVFRSAVGPGFSFSGSEGQSFDVFGRLWKLTYSDGSVATYRYHGVSRQPREVDLDGAVIARWPSYNARGQATEVQFGNGVTTSWDYVPETGLLDRARIVDTETNTTLSDLDYRFDGAGNVAEHLDRLDATKSRRFSYDSFQRLTGMNEGACLIPGAPCRRLSYRYDAAGSLLEKEGVTFTLEPGTQRPSTNGTELYNWSGSGNLLSRGLTTYRYDRRNMLHAVTDNQVLVQRNHHDQDGRRIVKERFDGLTSTRTFYLGRLSELTERRAGSLLRSAQSTRFVLGPDGAVVASVTRDVAQFRVPSFGSLQRFHLDTANHATLAGLFQAGQASVSLAVMSGALERWLSLALLLATTLGVAFFARRTGVSMSRRVRALVAVPLVAMLTTGCPPQTTPGPELPPGGLTSQLPPGTHFFHGDHLGSVAMVTDAEGAVTARLRYLPYGDLDPESMQDGDTTRRFTGQRYDAETRLYDFNARTYDPTIGRFLQADTLVPDSSSALGFNRYAYSKDNPLKYSDPSGHSWLSNAWKKLGDYASGLGPKGWLLLGAAVVSVVLAPFTGGASLYLYIGVATAVGVAEGIRAGSPEMVVGALATGLSAGFGLPAALNWTPQTGWAIAFTAPIPGGEAWGLKASVGWAQRGGFNAGVSLGIKNLSVSAGYSSNEGGYAGFGVGTGSVSVQAKYSTHGAASFGARYDNGALQVDAGFRSDRGFYLGVRSSMKVDSGVGDFAFTGGLSASFDSSGPSLSATASHAQFENADEKGLAGLALQQANEELNGERFELELL